MGKAKKAKPVHEAARKNARWIAVSTVPDVCKTPMGSACVPVPYTILGNLGDSAFTAESVYFTKQPAFRIGSRIVVVVGDEAGTAGGVQSGVNKGMVKPTSSSSSVYAEKQPVCRNNDTCEMNAPTVDAAGNTTGKIKIMIVHQNATIDKNGYIRKPDRHNLKGDPAKKPAVTDADLEKAAEELGVDKNVVKAFARQESLGSAFLEDGKAKILFEGHHFQEYTNGAYNASHPWLSWGYNPARSYGGNYEQWELLLEAGSLNQEAAYRATSWGKFQILGNNYQQAGFKTLEGFVGAMMESEQAQLKAFVDFTKGNPTLHNAMKTKDWGTMAKQYNGKDAINKGYDKSLKSKYDELEKEDAEKKKKAAEAKAAGADGVAISKK